MTKVKLDRSLSDLIQSKRLELGKTRKEFAEFCDLAPSIITKIENGSQQIVHKGTAEKLAKCMGLDKEFVIAAMNEKTSLEEDLVNNIVFAVNKFKPTDEVHVWLLLGLAISNNWRLRHAAISCLSYATKDIVQVEWVSNVLTTISEHDETPGVRFFATKILEFFQKPQREAKPV
jgi:transcriptional regulator with XRE-family HTH domain